MIGNSCVQAIAELAYGFLPSYSCHQQSFVPSPSVDSTLSLDEGAVTAVQWLFARK